MNRRAAETKERKTVMREGCPERWTDGDEREAGHSRSKIEKWRKREREEKDKRERGEEERENVGAQ